MSGARQVLSGQGIAIQAAQHVAHPVRWSAGLSIDPMDRLALPHDGRMRFMKEIDDAVFECVSGSAGWTSEARGC